MNHFTYCVQSGLIKTSASSVDSWSYERFSHSIVERWLCFPFSFPFTTNFQAISYLFRHFVGRVQFAIRFEWALHLFICAAAHFPWIVYELISILPQIHFPAIFCMLKDLLPTRYLNSAMCIYSFTHLRIQSIEDMVRFFFFCRRWRTIAVSFRFMVAFHPFLFTWPCVLYDFTILLVWYLLRIFISVAFHC